MRLEILVAESSVFWVLICYATTQLAIPLHQRRIQVERSNKVARKRLTKSNGTPAMDLGMSFCRNANRNPEWWGDLSQLQIQIKPKSGFEFVPRDTEELKFNQNLNSNLYRQIPRNLCFSILIS